MKKAHLFCLILIPVLMITTAFAEWTCPKCGRLNSGNFCPDCGTKKVVWSCLVCGSENSSSFCENCGAAKPTDEEIAKKNENEKLLKDYPLQFREYIEVFANQFFLQPSLVASIIRNESGFYQKAVSANGSQGLMQIKPEMIDLLAEEYGLDPSSIDDLLEPGINIFCGCSYLFYLGEKLNTDPVCMVTAYYAGQEQVALWLSDSSISDDGKTLSADKLPEGMMKDFVKRVMRDQKVYQDLYGLD